MRDNSKDTSPRRLMETPRPQRAAWHRARREETRTDAAGDLDLVRRARDGEARAVDELGRRLDCVPRMVRARDRMLGSRLSNEDLEDAGQDTLVALWRNLDRFQGTHPIEAWVWGFVVRHHRKATASRGGRRSTREPREEDLVVDAKHATGRLSLLAVRAAVAALASPTDEIVRLRQFDERSFGDIATCLGLSLTNVKARYYRGLARLRTLTRIRSLRWG